MIEPIFARISSIVLQVMMYWYQTKLAHSGQWVCGAGWGLGAKSGLASNQSNTQYSCSSICDKVVDLWRLAAFNPAISAEQRAQLHLNLIDYHKKAVGKVNGYWL